MDDIMDYYGVDRFLGYNMKKIIKTIVIILLCLSAGYGLLMLSVKLYYGKNYSNIVHYIEENGETVIFKTEYEARYYLPMRLLILTPIEGEYTVPEVISDYNNDFQSRVSFGKSKGIFIINTDKNTDMLIQFRFTGRYSDLCVDKVYKISVDGDGMVRVEEMSFVSAEYEKYRAIG
jgi:hypothetical protein